MAAGRRVRQLARRRRAVRNRGAERKCVLYIRWRIEGHSGSGKAVRWPGKRGKRRGMQRPIGCDRVGREEELETELRAENASVFYCESSDLLSRPFSAFWPFWGAYRRGMQRPVGRGRVGREEELKTGLRAENVSVFFIMNRLICYLTRSLHFGSLGGVSAGCEGRKKRVCKFFLLEFYI